MIDNESQRISRLQPRRSSSLGFSLVETLMGLMVTLIIVGISVIQIQPTLDNGAADTSLQTLLGKMRSAHDSAVNTRRQYRITFTSGVPATVKTEHLELVGTTPTWMSQPQDTTQLPGTTNFILISGVPTGANTPDTMGVGANPIDFDVDSGGGQSQIYFYPDGRALDSSGKINNGVVYIATPGKLSTSRAVSMYGASGRMKAWQISVGTPSKWVAR